MVSENGTNGVLDELNGSNGANEAKTCKLAESVKNGLIKCEYEPINEQVEKQISDLYSTSDPYVVAHPSNSVWPASLEPLSERIKDFKVREDDVWLVCYPRTGSTWTQELVWLLGNNLDYIEAMDMQQRRFPLLEFSTTLREGFIEEFGKIDELQDLGFQALEVLDDAPGRRFIKSHLYWEQLPRELNTVKPKIITTTRNIKDCIVSMFEFNKLIYGIKDDFEAYCQLMLDGNAPMGNPIDNLLRIWPYRDEPNILILSYEEMKKDLATVIKQVAKFMDFGRELTEKEMQKLLDHLNFKSMQNNTAVNLEEYVPGIKEDKGKFIRKGVIGDWKNYFTKELSEKFDKFIEEKTLGTGLIFKYE